MCTKMFSDEQNEQIMSVLYSGRPKNEGDA